MSKYTYSINVPKANQRISATQAPIESNFQAIAEFLNTNHIGFNDPVNFGKHLFTTLPFQDVDPSTSATEMVLYSKATGTPNAGEVFVRYPSDGDIIQISGSSIGQAGGSTNGWSYLPGNVLMKWGIVTGIIPGDNIILFPTSGNIPSFITEIYIVQYCPLSEYTPTIPFAYISSSSITQFVLTVPTVMSSTISWMAIGI